MGTITAVGELFERLLALAVPPLCESCGAFVKGSDVLCERCYSELPLISGDTCSSCGAPAASGRVGCVHCWDGPLESNLSLAEVWAATEYDGPAEGLVGSLKKRRSVQIARFCAALMASRVGLLPDNTVVVAVPPRRGSESAATVLAQQLARRLELQHQALLIPVRRTAGQKLLGAAERFQNSSDLYMLKRSAMAPGSVLIVDDVLTTGATVSSCASVLQKAGTRSIYCAALARTLR